MRYSKLSFLLVISLVFLLLVSLGLISTWFYYYFYKEDGRTAISSFKSTDSLTANDTRDSLQKMYSAALNSVDAPLSSFWQQGDTTSGDIDGKLVEYYRLREEISRLLKTNSSKAELDTARARIALLQYRIEELRGRTKAIENENKKLNEIVRHLSGSLKEGDRVDVVSGRINSDRKAKGNESEESYGILSVSPVQLRIKPIPANDGSATLTGDLDISHTSSASGTLYIVVLQPDRRILLNSDWDTGTFSTINGKKIYSVRIPFELNDDRVTSFTFTIGIDKLQKGTYTTEVYFEGKVVGKGQESW